MRDRPKVGLALGAGASRLSPYWCFASFGGTRYRPGFNSRSSIGAIVGALYAAGITPKMLEGISKIWI